MFPMQKIREIRNLLAVVLFLAALLAFAKEAPKSHPDYVPNEKTAVRSPEPSSSRSSGRTV
jgi:hypothetical protein